ncbi:MAG TPA: YigZ family protein, partial [Nautiliaceae bacterium]|nr:YigZ family protein [Nautiliaceae bacterium]
HNIFVLNREFGSGGIEYKVRDDIEKINLIKGAL